MGPAPLTGHAAIVAILADEVAAHAEAGLSFAQSRRAMRAAHPGITPQEIVDAEALHLARARVEAAYAGRPGVGPLEDELNRLLGMQGQARIGLHITWLDSQGNTVHWFDYVDLAPGEGVDDLQAAADEAADDYGAGPASGGPPANWEVFSVA